MRTERNPSNQTGDHHSNGFRHNKRTFVYTHRRGFNRSGVFRTEAVLQTVCYYGVCLCFREFHQQWD